MELIFVGALAIIALAIVTPIIAFKANEKANRLEHQLRHLYREVDQLKAQITSPKQESTQATIVAIEPQVEPQPELEPVTKDNSPSVEPQHVETPPTLPTHEPNAIHQWFDKCFDHMRDNWLVWIGGLAMVIGVGYLVQVVGSNFTFPPIARVLAAATISLILIAVGEWAHRKISAISTTFLSDKADAYIPAALYASGMSGLYATVIFSTVIYQFFNPTIALISMATLALLCLGLTARLGPLMAGLGLFGGYSAPFWIGGSEPNYLLLTSYILTISLAGLLTKFYSQIRWLATAVSIAHGLWLLLIASNIPSEQIITWFLLFVPISTYLLVFTPVMGWQLKLRFKPMASWPMFHPLFPALLLAGVSAVVMERALSLSSGYLLVFCYPALLLILPVLRGKIASRSFYGITILAILQAMVSAFIVANETLAGEVWIVFAVLIVIAGARTQTQCQLGDKHKIAYWMASLCLPALAIITLVYINHGFAAYLNSWTIFAIASLSVSLLVANKYKQLVMENSIALHALILTISYCYLDPEFLPLAMAVQVLIASMQNQQKLCSPGKLVIKIMMALLIIKMSLVPFVPQLQVTWLPEWTWMLTSFVPAIAILLAARQIIGKQDLEFREWFEAAILHLVVLLTFTQTNYWLLGSYNFFTDISFYSVSLFTCQTVALSGVYQLKYKLASRLRTFYQYYSFGLLAVAALLFATLNTVYQPLMNTYVTGADWPVFNWLTIGWVLPAAILAITAYRGYCSDPIKAVHLYSVAAAAIGLWVLYSIRQFWQDGSMTLAQPTGMAEMFSYSIAIILIGAATTYLGVLKNQALLQKVGLATLGVAVCKVFLLDTAALEGIWRAISFLGLGGSLVALGWIFQRLHYRSKQSAEPQSNETLAD
ncbi:DUF2339 domain-containing protein [Vibrio sp. LaRot3]|uniref:DUF2339 domain-containing protein n=1 Tax=Vibrio sp. LaRot3 TaxID=2998829 RepID=UPI0022CE2F26|nr:DUF2339 domain-containing protein [Vibrio sp. LaRot3]MDA0150343.1 DUF2339 domain-containing protein [Vibrio sp. LaRot3]